LIIKVFDNLIEIRSILAALMQAYNRRRSPLLLTTAVPNGARRLPAHLLAATLVTGTGRFDPLVIGGLLDQLLNVSLVFLRAEGRRLLVYLVGVLLLDALSQDGLVGEGDGPRPLALGELVVVDHVDVVLRLARGVQVALLLQGRAGGELLALGRGQDLVVRVQSVLAAH